MECIQEAGDVVVIPSGYWHQVYHLTETLGFASQFASVRNINIVVDTLLAWRRTTWEVCTEGEKRPVVEESMEGEALRRVVKQMVGMLGKCGALSTGNRVPPRAHA